MAKRIPADMKRCQVYEYRPMTMGGNVERRCANTPAYVVSETVAGEDGLTGSQSVCKSCKQKWVERSGNANVDDTWEWKKIGGMRWEAIGNKSK